MSGYNYSIYGDEKHSIFLIQILYVIQDTDQLDTSESMISVLFDPLRVTQPFFIGLGYLNITQWKIYRNKDWGAER